MKTERQTEYVKCEKCWGTGEKEANLYGRGNTKRKCDMCQGTGMREVIQVDKNTTKHETLFTQ